MPQLDYHTFAPQLVWLAITFVVLYVLMSRLALPKVRAAIEGRRRHLDDDLGRAAEQETLRVTGEKLGAEAAARQRQLAASLAEQIAAAEARIAAGKDQALGEIRNIAAEVGGAV